MTAESRSFTPQEFLDKLGKDELQQPLTLTGMVKANEGAADELLFAPGTRCTDWTSVPLAVIESVETFGVVPCKDHSHHRVKLIFKAPGSSEAAAYAKLLRACVTGQSRQTRIVRTAKSGGADFAGYTCTDLEIDADGTVWSLVSSVDHGDWLECTYVKG